MNKLGRLIKNELIKKFKAPSTSILIAIFLVVCFGLPFLGNITSYDYNDGQQINWQIDDLNMRIETEAEYSPNVYIEKLKLEKNNL